MAAGLRGCLWVAILQAVCCLGLRTVHEPARAGKLKPAEPASKKAVEIAVAATVDQLQDREAEIVQQQKDLRQLILYVEKVKDSYNKEDGLLNGKMDQADMKIAQKFLNLASDQGFMRVVYQMLKDLSLVVKHVPALTERRVEEVLKKPRSTPEDRIQSGNRFLVKETVLLGTQLDRAAASIQKVIDALPRKEEFSMIAALSTKLLEDAVNATKTSLGKITGRGGNVFCSSSTVAVEEEILPMVKYVTNFLPRISSYASAHDLESAKALPMLVQRASAVSNLFMNMLQQDMRTLTEKVCSVIQLDMAEPAMEKAAPVSQQAAPTPEGAAQSLPGQEPPTGQP